MQEAIKGHSSPGNEAVRFIGAEDVLPLRSLVLRNGRPEAECAFASDVMPGAFHLGFFCDDRLTGIASFHPQKLDDRLGVGYQLRGMASAPGSQGRGFGKKLLEHGISHLRDAGADYLWCNARRIAYGFYEQLGFTFVSEEFEVEDIGPHKVMILPLTD